MKRANFTNKNYFESIDTQLKAYFLGYIAADGCVQDAGIANLTFQMTLHEKDLHVLELLKSELNSTHKIQTYSKKHDSGNITIHKRLSISNKKLTDDLINLGIVLNKTLILSNIIENIEHEFRDSFCLGYFDGDGTVTRQYTRPNKEGIRTLANTGQANIKGTVELLSGIKNHLNIHNQITKQKDKNVHILRITSVRDLNRFYSIYSTCPFYLNRKKLKFEDFINNEIYQQ